MTLNANPSEPAGGFRVFKGLEIFAWWELSYAEDIFTSITLAVLVMGSSLGVILEKKNEINLNSKDI